MFPDSLLEGGWSGTSESYFFSSSSLLWPKYFDYDTLLKIHWEFYAWNNFTLCNKENMFSCRAREISQNNRIVQQ